MVEQPYSSLGAISGSISYQDTKWVDQQTDFGFLELAEEYLLSTRQAPSGEPSILCHFVCRWPPEPCKY